MFRLIRNEKTKEPEYVEVLFVLGENIKDYSELWEPLINSKTIEYLQWLNINNRWELKVRRIYR